MERIVETHEFGPHRVVVLEHAADDETTYSVVVDDIVVTEDPLPFPPRFEDVVRIYARSQSHGSSGGSGDAAGEPAAE